MRLLPAHSDKAAGRRRIELGSRSALDLDFAGTHGPKGAQPPPGVFMLAGLFALVFASGLAGIGVYINGVEQPARLTLEDSEMLKEWGPSDRRGVALMAILALASAIAGLLAYFESSDVRYAIGAVIAAASWPYTIYVMGPVDNQISLLAPRDLGAARTLLRQWGLLEYGQTAIAAAAVVTFIWAL